jgi:hypothetical protein
VKNSQLPVCCCCWHEVCVNCTRSVSDTHAPDLGPALLPPPAPLLTPFNASIKLHLTLFTGFS